LLPVPSSCSCFGPDVTTALYPLSLLDALPISRKTSKSCCGNFRRWPLAELTNRASTHQSDSQTVRLLWFGRVCRGRPPSFAVFRSEEHTSELQSRFDLVCRLLLEKKKTDCVHT